MRPLLALLIVIIGASVARDALANPIRKVWIAIDQGNAGCKTTLDDFSTCLFDYSNYRALLNTYPGGFDYEVGASKVIPGCALGDYTCVQNQAQFPVGTDDILMHVHAGAYCGGAHNERGNTVVFNGKNVSVRTGWIDATSCKCETPFLEHEVYEAANDQASADCCNGQGWLNQACCSSFGGACNSGCCGNIAQNGWYDDMVCPNGTFRGQYLAPSPFLSDPNKCAKLAVSCPGGGSGKVLHAKCGNANECCSGLTCQSWRYDSTMQPEQVCCGGADATCKAAADCCGSLTCTSGKCTCVPDGTDCLNDGDCCDGSQCTSNKCAKKPPPPVDASVPDASAGDASDVDASDAGADGSADPVIEVPGCACQSSPSRDQRGLWLALGVVLLAIRRRRPMIR